MIVELGTNRFIDCGTILGWRGEPLLAVGPHPLTVTLRLPSEQGTSLLPLEERSQLPITTVLDGHCRAVFAGDHLVLLAVLRDPDRVHLRVDLRPFGLVIHDEAEGLRVGSNLIAQNEISNAAVAIALA